MKKRILTILISLITCITISARYTQQVEITIDKGLSCNAVRSFARDSYGRLWVGTTNGANLISNGTISQYQYFTVGNDDIVAGDIISIGWGFVNTLCKIFHKGPGGSRSALHD